MPDDALKTTLGFDAAQAIATLKQMEIALASYTAAMRKAALATRAYNKAAMGVDAKLKGQAAAIGGVTSAQSTLISKSKQQTKATEQIKETTGRASRQLRTLEDQTKKTGTQMILTWQSVIRIFTIQIIHQMISKLTGELREAVSASMGLEIQLAEIQTIGGPLRKDFEGLANEVRELSDAFGVQAEIAAEAIYQTLSNQVVAAKDSFMFFAAAVDFSIAAVTSANASVNLLTATINAFGYSASQVTLIGAKLFKTIELGRIRGEEFASTFGRVAVLASRLGVTLDEVLAAIATLTISGLRYNEAFTLINNVMLKLIRPTEELQGVFNELGIATIEAGIQAYGFQGILAKLAEKTGESATEMGKLFGRVRAVRGALGLTGQAAERYAENLEKIRAAGPETLFEAKRLIFETNAKQIQMEIEELRNVVVFDFGRKTLDIINEIINAFGGLQNIIASLGIGLGVTTAGLLALGAAAHPVIAAMAGLGAVAAGLVYSYKKFTETAIDQIDDRLDAEKRAILEINAKEAKLAEDRINHFRATFSEMQRYLIDRLAMAHDIKEAAMEAERFITEDLNEQLDDRQSAFETFVDGLVRNMEKARDNIKSTQEEIFVLQRQLSEEIFEGQKRGYDEAWRAMMNVERATKLSRQAAIEFRKDHRERAKLLFAETHELLNQAKSTAISLENQSLELDVRSEIRRTIEKQISLQKQFTRGETQRIRALQTQVPIEKARSRRISILIDKIKEFAIFTEEGVISYPTVEDAMAAVYPFLRDLQREFDEVGSKINIFKRLEETGEEDLEKAILAAVAPLWDIFEGREIPLKFAYEQQIKFVFKRLNEVAEQIPIDIKLRFEKLGFDVSTLKGIEEASKGLVETFNAIERSIRASSQLKGEQQKLNAQMDAVHDTAEAIRGSFADQVGVVGTFREALKDPLELGRRVWQLDVKSKGTREASNQLIRDQATILGQVNARLEEGERLIRGNFDPDRFADVLTSLEGTAIQYKTMGKTDISKNIMFAIARLKEAAETAVGLNAIVRGTQIQFGKEELDALERALINQQSLLGGNIKSLGDLGVGAETAASTANTAFESMKDQLISLREEIAKTAAAQAGLGGGGRSLGGLIYRQYGGYIPKGTDTIPAMLSPGEFVVNAKSTKQFFSQLMAINAGVKPAYRQEGGPVTTVGDINITVQGAPTPVETGREMMGKFRREFRRRTGVLVS